MTIGSYHILREYDPKLRNIISHSYNPKSPRNQLFNGILLKIIFTHLFIPV